MNYACVIRILSVGARKGHPSVSQVRQGIPMGLFLLGKGRDALPSLYVGFLRELDFCIGFLDASFKVHLLWVSQQHAFPAFPT